MTCQIRAAGVHDAAVIATQRAQMFADMDELSGEEFALVEANCTGELTRFLRAGEYHGWLAEVDGAVVAGVGLMRRPLLSRGGRPFFSYEAYVMNVYTAPAFRRSGMARALLETAIAWCRAHEVSRVVLHASIYGRPLYEQLGFLQTNEMKLDLVARS